jgi:hypothetical protein
MHNRWQTRAAPVSRTSTWHVAAVCTLALRVLYSALAAFLLRQGGANPEFVQVNAFTAKLLSPADGSAYLLLGPWERFDALWYLHIASSGYDVPASVVFYPLYPALIWTGSLVTRNDLAAGVLLSTVFTFLLLWGVHKLAALDLSADAAARATLAASVWPASFVYFGAYAESLLLASIVWSIYFARAGSWVLSAAVGFAAAGTKAVGILVLIPLVVIAWKARDRRAWVVALAPLSAAAFAAYLEFSGRMATMEAYSRYWETTVSYPWMSLGRAVEAAFQTGYLHPLPFHLAVFAGTAALCFFPSVRVEYKMYAAAAILFIAMKEAPVHQQQWSRYALALFPAWFAVARFTGLFPFVVAGGLLVNLMMLRVFVLWSGIV